MRLCLLHRMWQNNARVARSAIEAVSSMEAKFLNDAQIILPLDQQHKLNRVLVTMQQRFVAAKTDMEDLIARLNQEMTVKEYLTTMGEKSRAELEKSNASSEKDLLLQDLDSKQEQIDKLQKRLEGVELKSKAAIKIFVKEVKFLRSSQAELKEMLNQSMKEKTELEGVLQNEKQKWAHLKSARKKLLHECEILQHRLQECSVNFLAEEEDKFTVNPSSLYDTLDLLETSDNRIGLLLAELQGLTLFGTKMKRLLWMGMAIRTRLGILL